MGRPRKVSDEEILAAARRAFLAQGVNVSATDIAPEIGISHTTIFNRFGSKEALMIAALGPPERIPWVATLEAGPDERPIRQQLLEHAKVMAAYFEELQAGLSVLGAAGIASAPVCDEAEEGSSPAQAFQALAAWLRRAQAQGRLAECDVETLTSTILGALHNFAFKRQVCSQPICPSDKERHVERFIDLLWSGIGVAER